MLREQNWRSQYVKKRNTFLSYHGLNGAQLFTAVFLLVWYVISKASVLHKITNLQLFIVVSGAFLFVGSIAKCVVVLTSFLSSLSILPKHTLSGSRLGHLSHWKENIFTFLAQFYVTFSRESSLSDQCIQVVLNNSNATWSNVEDGLNDQTVAKENLTSNTLS